MPRKTSRQLAALFQQLCDLGVQGKIMWHQIQAMGAHMQSKARPEVGEADWHDVEWPIKSRVLSSSVYIGGIATELKTNYYTPRGAQESLYVSPRVEPGYNY